MAKKQGKIKGKIKAKSIKISKANPEVADKVAMVKAPKKKALPKKKKGIAKKGR
jgi:hypothetical protein